MARFSLLPRNEAFHSLLQALSARAHACACRLHDLTASDAPSGDVRAWDALRAERMAARGATGEITAALCRSFVTPFDREDIQALADELYKTAKTMEKAAERIRLYGLAGRDSDFGGQIALIVKAAETVDGIVGDLTRGRLKGIESRIDAMYALEHEADAVLSGLLAALFAQDRPARDLILRKDLYDMLEKIVDRYRDAAGIVLQIVLKNG